MADSKAAKVPLGKGIAEQGRKIIRGRGRQIEQMLDSMSKNKKAKSSRNA